MKWLRIIRKILVWTVISVLSLLLITALLVYVFEDDIKKYAVEELNKHLNTTVEVQEIELSIWSDFPNASLNFKNVFIKDAFENKRGFDTLCYAERLSLQFDIWDMINSDYTVKTIRLENSDLNLFVDSTGDHNYHITKPSEDTTASEFKFALENIEMENVRFSYINQSIGHEYAVDIHESHWVGNFTEESSEIKGSGDMQIKSIKNKAISLLKNKPSDFDLTMAFKDGNVSFSPSKLSVDKMLFGWHGNIKNDSLDLDIQGSQIDLKDFLLTFSSADLAILNEYQTEGKVAMKVVVNGPVGTTQAPDINSEFKITEGSLIEPSKQIEVTNLSMEGNFISNDQGNEELLKITNLKATTLDGQLDADLSIENFKRPILSFNVNGNVDLKLVHDLFLRDVFEEASGKILINGAWKLVFLDPEWDWKTFELQQSRGTLSARNIALHTETHQLNGINGDIVLSGENAAVKNFNVSIKDNSFFINGAFNNLLTYARGKGALNILGDIESERIDIEQLFAEQQSKNSTTKKSSKPQAWFPSDININASISTKELVVKGHTLREVQLSGKLRNQKLKIPKFSTQLYGGTVSGNMELNAENIEKILMNAHFKLKNIDVNSCFKDWNNFDQQVITDQNMFGTINSTIDLVTFLDNKGSIIYPSLNATAKTKITNGKMVNVEMMKDITGFMRDNGMIKLALNKHIDSFEEKLLNIQFKTLENTFRIENEKLIIPRMTIANNALDINLNGTHGFDNMIDYHFNFRFRQLKSTPEYTEFGKIEDDGLGWRIFLSMNGHLDDPKFQMDKEERKRSFQEKMKMEKQTIKSMLKQEFGWFKGDTTVKGYAQKNQREVEFKFFDSEEEEQQFNQKIDSAKVKKKKNTGKVHKYFDKLKKEQEAEKEKGTVEFDILD